MKKILLGLLVPLQIVAATFQEGDNVFVVIPENAATTVKVAAEELETHLAKRTGAAVRITDQAPVSGKTIRLAMKDGSGLKPDGFVIECTGDTIDIYGNDTNLVGQNEPFSLYFNEKSKGTLSGVYCFLEKYCDIAWIAPGELGVCMPPQSAVTIPDGRFISEPAMKMRHTVDMYEMRKKYPDRAEYGENLRNDLLRWGVRIRLSGRMWPVQGCHTIERMQLVKTYGKEHPEYFSLQKDGSRGGKFGGLCWSNPEVTDILFRAADARFSGKSPQAGGLGTEGPYWDSPFDLSSDEFMIDPVDEYEKCPCTCERCRNSNITEEVWKRIAEVAQRIKEKHPGKRIVTLAYPPKQEPPKFPLPDNVLVRLTLPGSNGLANERTNTYYQGLLEKWHTLQKQPVPIWIYYVAQEYGTAGTVETSPMLFKKYMQQVRSFTDNVFFESSYVAQTQRNYELWMQSRLLWNPDADLDALKKEYFDRGYGAAAPDIQKFYDRLETLWLRILKETWDSGDKEIPNLFEGNWRANKSNRQIFKTIYTAEELTAMSRMLADGKSKVPADSVIAKRIALLEKWIVGVAAREREQIMFADDVKNLTDLCVTVIDHAPGKQDWANASWNILNPFADKRNEKLNAPGRFKLLIDPVNTTIRAELSDPLIRNSKSVKRTAENAGDIWLDNDFEVFISNNSVFRQLMMNDLGDFIVYDIVSGVRRKFQHDGIKVKAARNPSGWTAEIVLPHAVTGIDPTISGSCRLNLLRSRNVNGAPTEYSSWAQAVGSDSVLDTDMYGRLLWADVSKMKIEYPQGVNPVSKVKMRLMHKADFSRDPGETWHHWAHPDIPPKHRWNPDAGHRGKGCLEIEYPGKSEGSWSYWLPVKPGNRIRISAWIRHSTGRGRMSFGYMDKDAGWIGYETYSRSITIPSYGSWVRCAFETTVPDDKQIYQVTLGFNSPDTPGILWIDDVVIEKK